MTIKGLKKIIKNLPDNMKVILQKDEEGNGFSPAAGADADCVYIPDTTWSGEMYGCDWSAEDACMNEDEWKELKDNHPKVLVIFPIN